MAFYSQAEYNNEPVHYCVNCISLNIKELHNSNLHACRDCGNVKFEETHIDNWTELYIKEYGHPFLQKDIKTLEE